MECSRTLGFIVAAVVLIFSQDAFLHFFLVRTLYFQGFFYSKDSTMPENPPEMKHLYQGRLAGPYWGIDVCKYSFCLSFLLLCKKSPTFQKWWSKNVNDGSSSRTHLWVPWLVYAAVLVAKLIPIYLFVARFTDSQPKVGSNVLKVCVAATSVVYLCLTQAFFHNASPQASDGTAQSSPQASDGTAQSSPQASDGTAQSGDTPHHSVDRMTMGVVFDIIDNAELLDLLLRDGRRGHNPDTDKEELNTIKKGMTCVVTVVGTLALMLPAIALLSLEASQTPQPSSKEDAKPARRSSDEVPSAQNQLEPAQGDAERGQSPSDEERTAPDQLKSAQEEPKTRDKRLQVSSTFWKRLYLVASIIMNLIFFVLRVIIAFWHNNEVGIFIAKNIIFLIAYVLEFCETLEHKGGADSSDSASPSPTSVGDDVAQRTSTCTTGNLDESGADPRPQ